MAVALGFTALLFFLFRDRGTTDVTANTSLGRDVIAQSASLPEETLYVLRTTNMRDRPTAQGSAVLRSWSRGERVQGRWATGADPTTRWLRIETPQGVGYIWEANLAPALIEARNPGIVTHDCQGEGCFVGGSRFITRPVRLFADRFEWNDNSHDSGFMAPRDTRVEVIEKIVVTWRVGRATLICSRDQQTWHADRSWRLESIPNPGGFASPRQIETLYYLGEGYLAGRVLGSQSDVNGSERVSFPGDCLNSQSEPVAQDWISVRLPDGRSGWTREMDAFVCNSIYDNDQRCSRLENR